MIPVQKLNYSKFNNLEDKIITNLINFLSNEEFAILYTTNRDLKYKFIRIFKGISESIMNAYNAKYEKHFKAEEANLLVIRHKKDRKSVRKSKNNHNNRYKVSPGNESQGP